MNKLLIPEPPDDRKSMVRQKPEERKASMPDARKKKAPKKPKRKWGY